MDFSGNGSPWVSVTAKSDIDVDTLDWSKDGSPWWGSGIGGYIVLTMLSAGMVIPIP